MSERKINLEEILNKELNKSKYGIPEMDFDVYENIKIAMYEACDQTLKLAAENANLIEYNTNKTAFTAHNMGVNKQSITDTIYQVE